MKRIVNWGGSRGKKIQGGSGGGEGGAKGSRGVRGEDGLRERRVPYGRRQGEILEGGPGKEGGKRGKKKTKAQKEKKNRKKRTRSHKTTGNNWGGKETPRRTLMGSRRQGLFASESATCLE